jgi:hypothetical protein
MADIKRILKVALSPKGFALPDLVGETLTILAKRDAGKSYTAKLIVEELLEHGRQVVVLDPIGHWYGLRTLADGKPGYPIIVMGGDNPAHRDVPLEPTSGKVIADFVVDERASVVLDISPWSKGEQVRFVTDFASRLYQKNRSALALVCEEADMFAPQRPFGEEARCLRAMQVLSKQGRGRGIGVISITQRPATLNKDVLTQSEMLIVLKVLAPQDRAAIHEWVKVAGDTDKEKVMMDSLASLPRGEGWVWSPPLDVFERVAFRRLRTLDTSKTPKFGEADTRPAVKLAEIDLKSLTTRIAETIEKAKAEDPATLRQKIIALEKQVKTASVSVFEPPSSRTHAIDPETLVEVRKMVPAFDALMKDVMSADTEAAASLTQLVGLNHAPFSDVESRIRMARNSLSNVRLNHLGLALTKLRDTVVRVADAIKDAAGGRKTAAPTRIADTRELHHTPRPASRGSGDATLKTMPRNMLTVIAQRGKPLTKKQIRAFTGYADSGPTSSAFALLVSNGFVESVEGNKLDITPAGLAALGAYEPLPTGRALRDQILAKPSLTKMEREMLTVLFEAYPHDMAKKDIREQAGDGYSDSGPVSSAFGMFVSQEWAVKTTNGRLKASPTLFED